MNPIQFKPLQENDLILLYQWFQEPLINQLYARNKAWSLEEISAKYLPRIQSQEKIPSFIVYKDNNPIGYIQYYCLADYLPEGISTYNPLFKEYYPEELAGIKSNSEYYNQHGFMFYAVELKATREMIGFLGLKKPSFEAHFTPAIEIGWRLASKHWNKGYATEGAKAVLDYGFNKLNLDEIVSFTAVNNIPSRRVMQKIGMHHNPADDFDHPKLTQDSPLRRHVLYRLSNNGYLKNQASIVD